MTRSIDIGRWPLLLVFLGCLTACYPGLPASGIIGGQLLDTGVDAPIAQYYLDHYLAGEYLNPEFDQRIDSVYQAAKGPIPDREELKKLSSTFSTDFAALYFADRLSRISINQKLQVFYNRVFQETRNRIRHASFSLSDSAKRYEILFVPGFLYQRHKMTGADFRQPRETLDQAGVPYRFIATDEDGPIEINAEAIAEAIAAGGDSGRRLIVVSASKSGPEVALALTLLGQDKLDHVAAWLNLVGTLQGSPLADQGVWQKMVHIVGNVDKTGLKSLTTTLSRQRFKTFRLPIELLVVNFIGIPVTGSLSRLARKGHRKMMIDGPSDGLSLLPDLLAPGGITLVELGSDHFLLTRDIEIKTIALATTLMRWLEDH